MVGRCALRLVPHAAGSHHVLLLFLLLLLLLLVWCSAHHAAGVATALCLRHLVPGTAHPCAANRCR
jgi:hypothetical protein